MELKKGLEKIDRILNDFLIDDLWCKEDLQKVGEARGVIHTLVESLAITDVTTRLFNYKCTKCGSTYTKLKKPLSYSDCQAYKGRNPNPILCGGRLISTN